MNGEVNLKPCPFCGGKAEICEFENGYYIACAVCNSCGVGIDAVCSKEKVVSAWNRRAPEPGTSVIRWTRYDGTPETLPEERKFFLLNPIRMRSEVIPMPAILAGGCFSINLTSPMDREMQLCEKRPEIGDAWAYLPTPPEGQE